MSAKMSCLAALQILRTLICAGSRTKDGARRPDLADELLAHHRLLVGTVRGKARMPDFDEGSPAEEAEMERQTGFVVPGTKSKVEFTYRLTRPARTGPFQR
jgi:hypothetical protein